MKKKITYTDEPIEGKRIKDFIPSPENLLFKEENVRVTITLSKRSIEYFKRWANRQHAHYQTMMRKVLDTYAMHHAK
ncbi:MAG: CopG family transcriptional regulator [Elusimicrobia bacterium]|nr:CopG family transcriptional regulator [Candidatus Liberimonas magnetica]